MSKAIIKTTTTTAPEITPEAITGQWNKAQMGLVEIIRFGAMLMQVESYILPRENVNGMSRHHPNLGSWLAAHCPSVNYKTAMGYKAAAENLKRAAGLAEEVPLLAAMNGLDDEYEAIHAAVMGILEGSSLRLLKGGGVKTAPRVEAAKTPAEEEAELKKMAETTITDAVNLLTAYIEGELWRTMSPTNVRHYTTLLKDKVQVIAAAVR